MTIYSMRDDQGVAENCEAHDLDDARNEARAWVARGDYGEIESTIWLDVWIDDLEAGELADKLTVALDPQPPKCEPGESHDWQAPHDLVGGIKENPGVWGHGGGVIMLDACALCGCKRVTDTWAQRPDNGQQGLTSVRYEPGAYTAEEISRALRGES
ncbi:MAG: hypothetical protein WDO74_23430 [Pseudomonadota bacterium]